MKTLLNLLRGKRKELDNATSVTNDYSIYDVRATLSDWEQEIYSTPGLN